MKRICCAAIASIMALSIFSFTAFGEIPNTTVVIGNKAFSLEYANDKANYGTIINAIQEANKTKGQIYIKSNGMWFDNSGSILKDTTVIPEVTYLNEDGSEAQYEKGDGEIINAEEFYVVDIF